MGIPLSRELNHALVANRTFFEHVRINYLYSNMFMIKSDSVDRSSRLYVYIYLLNIFTIKRHMNTGTYIILIVSTGSREQALVNCLFSTSLLHVRIESSRV